MLPHGSRIDGNGACADGIADVSSTIQKVDFEDQRFFARLPRRGQHGDVDFTLYAGLSGVRCQTRDTESRHSGGIACESLAGILDKKIGHLFGAFIAQIAIAVLVANGERNFVCGK